MAAPPRFVVLMPWGRVGSNLLALALQQGNRVRLENEPTTRIRTQAAREGLRSEQIRAAQDSHLAQFLDEADDRFDAHGLKLSHRSLVAPEAYLRRLAEHRFRVVLMRRDNFLKCAVSQMRARIRAEAAGAWRSPWAVAAHEPKPGPTPIDPAEAVRLAGVFRKSQDAMMRTADAVFGGDWLAVEYGDLQRDPEAVIRAAHDHIGLSAPERVIIPHRKATSDRLRDDIENYDDFEARVVSAGLGAFLAEGV